MKRRKRSQKIERERSRKKVGEVKTAKERIIHKEYEQREKERKRAYNVAMVEHLCLRETKSLKKKQ